MHPDRVLVKTSIDNSHWRWRDAQKIEVPGAYTLLRVFSTTGNTPKRPPHIASAFLGKYAFITAVDLMQWEKLDSRNF